MCVKEDLIERAISLVFFGFLFCIHIKFALRAVHAVGLCLIDCMILSIVVTIAPCEHLYWIPNSPLHAKKVTVAVASYEQPFKGCSHTVIFIATNGWYGIQCKCLSSVIATTELNSIQPIGCEKYIAVAIASCEQPFIFPLSSTGRWRMFQSPVSERREMYQPNDVQQLPV